MPRFSILIPCYNCSKTLPNTLSSCLQQKFDDFEVILIDDYSKDNVVSIYKHYLPAFVLKNIPLTYHRNSVNSGVSFSRNTAWDLAIGEYICFLDSDDIWHESKLQIINRFLSTNNCYCLCHSYTDNKDIFFTERDTSNYEIFKLNLLKLLLKNPSQTSCFVLKRSITDRFDNTMSYCEDYDLWLKVSKSHPVYQLCGKPLTLLSRPQKTPGGLSSNRVKMRLGELTAYFNFTQRNNIFIILLPLFLAYSMLKHIRSEFGYIIRLLKQKLNNRQVTP
ncbi:glycosyltransferase family 2 protein [Geotalea toluenoxydans]|uniref:glycosyltransferase family 2 protein n=1 Tax=Geotalea toluenoxydans TaxID=421624 RepID=UPI000A5226D7